MTRHFYCPALAHQVAWSDALVALPAEESHHAARVLRLKPGDCVRLFDGVGFFYDAELVTVEKKCVEAVVRMREASAVEPRHELIVALGLLKGRKMDFIIQKATELGVGRFCFFPAERSVPVLREKTGRLERWRKIALGACKQCEGAVVPEITVFDSLAEMLGSLPEVSSRLVCWEGVARGDVSFAGPRLEDADWPVVLLIGPEGGVNGAELSVLEGHGFQPFGLGRRILRAETAVLAACCLVLQACGDLPGLGAGKGWRG